ncbi:hypothetical protein [Methylophaga thalassica]|uniref:hypothetical protein n=1 Tax=Methylophaga thalassica TaxID=40223 RepID=UPI002E7B1626|nr:hypothetical protein [Methylophaga thalassica]WVI83642.1 hypothetical protein VSX76_00925 [Methylophaga thalassica]
MNFQKFENWVKNHQIFSFILIPLFMLGIFFQLIGAYEWFKNTLLPQEYPVIEINLDKAILRADETWEGTGMGTSVFKVKLNEKGSYDLMKALFNNPTDIYLVRVVGSRYLSDFFDSYLKTDFVVMSEGRFFISLDSLCHGYEENLGTEKGKYYCHTVELYFPSIDKNYVWSSFEEGPTSTASFSFKMTGFVRFFRYHDNQIPFRQYQAKYVSPDPDIAQRTLKSLEEGKYNLKYILTENDANGIMND